MAIKKKRPLLGLHRANCSPGCIGMMGRRQHTHPGRRSPPGRPRTCLPDENRRHPILLLDLPTYMQHYFFRRNIWAACVPGRQNVPPPLHFDSIRSRENSAPTTDDESPRDAFSRFLRLFALDRALGLAAFDASVTLCGSVLSGTAARRGLHAGGQGKQLQGGEV